MNLQRSSAVAVTRLFVEICLGHGLRRDDGAERVPAFPSSIFRRSDCGSPRSA